MGAEANGGEKQLKFLIYGRTGWIGGLLGKLCEERGIEYEYGSGRLENRLSLEADITAVKPSHVFNAAGVTGRPNVDWCESHKVETIRTNVVGTLTLADVCRENNLILINYATGCIFEYDSSHTLGSGVGFKETDTPNFIGSFYSKTKAMVLTHSPTSQHFLSISTTLTYVMMSCHRWRICFRTTRTSARCVSECPFPRTCRIPATSSRRSLDTTRLSTFPTP